MPDLKYETGSVSLNGQIHKLSPQASTTKEFRRQFDLCHDGSTANTSLIFLNDTAVRLQVEAIFPSYQNDLILHWGMCKSNMDEFLVAKAGEVVSEDDETKVFGDDAAMQTVMKRRTIDGDDKAKFYTTLEIKTKDIMGLSMVFHYGEGWYKFNGWENIKIDIQDSKSILAGGKSDYWLERTTDGGSVIFEFSDPAERAIQERKQFAEKHMASMFASDNTVSDEVKKFAQERIINPILNLEVFTTQMCLMHRYNLASDMVEQILASGFESPIELDYLLGWVFVYIRFHYIRELDWERRYNCKPADQAYANERLTLILCGFYQKHECCRWMCAQMVASLGRGGCGGEAWGIREEVLAIFHRHKIPERRQTHFYEQWHQKLHNNATIDDVAICEALLAFLKSGGDVNLYWKVIYDFGLSRERLASYERPITSEPCLYIGDGNVHGLIQSYQSYLATLRRIFDGADLSSAIGHVQDFLRDKIDLGLLYHINHNFDKRFEDIHNIRKQIGGFLHHNASNINVYDLRNTLFLDGALERLQPVCLQLQIDGLKFDENFGELLHLVKECVNNFCEAGSLPRDAWNGEEFYAIRDDVNSQLNESTDPLLLKAICDRLSRWASNTVSYDYFSKTIGNKSTFLGTAMIRPSQHSIDMFAEELIRGNSLFLSVSQMLQRIDGILRRKAQLPPWQILSLPKTEVSGIVRVADTIPLEAQDEDSIYIVNGIAGEEDIPRGIRAIFIKDHSRAPDSLAHVCVRARTCKVLLAVCFEPDRLLRQLEEKFSGKMVKLDYSDISSNHGEVCMEETMATTVATSQKKSAPREIKFKSLTVASSKPVPILMEDMLKNDKMIGSKSLNLAKLKQHVCVPNSVTIPFGTFGSLVDKDLASELKGAVSLDKLGLIRELVGESFTKTSIPSWFVNLLEEVEGGEISNSGCWKAMIQVYQSMFTMRAWSALIDFPTLFEKLDMAVLVQKVAANVKYSFVLHTADPNNSDLLCGELVFGLGETLVSGSYSGRALSFTMDRSCGSISVKSFPSKSVALYPCESNSLIFRSDSNCEDLKEFAGAGLFDSIIAGNHSVCSVSPRYSADKLIYDGGFRNNLLAKIGQIGLDIEKKVFSNQAQDIEGVVCGENDQIVIVQSRPQM